MRCSVPGCERVIVGLGHNARPLGPARACDMCAPDVMVARLTAIVDTEPPTPSSPALAEFSTQSGCRITLRPNGSVPRYSTPCYATNPAAEKIPDVLRALRALAPRNGRIEDPTSQRVAVYLLLRFLSDVIEAAEEPFPVDPHLQADRVLLTNAVLDAWDTLGKDAQNDARRYANDMNALNAPCTPLLRPLNQRLCQMSATPALPRHSVAAVGSRREAAAGLGTWPPTEAGPPFPDAWSAVDVVELVPGPKGSLPNFDVSGAVLRATEFMGRA